MTRVDTFSAGGFEASLHTTDGIGSHTSYRIAKLAAPTLGTALEQATECGLLARIGEQQALRWVDFPIERSTRQWMETELATTHLAIRDDPTHESHFVSAGQLLSSMLHDGVIEPRWLSHAHEKTMENFKPVEGYKPMATFVRSWLPDFCLRDRPHPPMPTARTNSLRFLAALISYEKSHRTAQAAETS